MSYTLRQKLAHPKDDAFASAIQCQKNTGMNSLNSPTRKSHLLRTGLSHSPTFRGNRRLFQGQPSLCTSQRRLLVWQGCQAKKKTLLAFIHCLLPRLQHSPTIPSSPSHQILSLITMWPCRQRQIISILMVHKSHGSSHFQDLDGWEPIQTTKNYMPHNNIMISCYNMKLSSLEIMSQLYSRT